MRSPKPTFDRRAAKEHLIALAAEHNLTVVWVNSWAKAEAWPPSLAVTIPHVRSARDYLVALHEFGHVLSPHARGLSEAGVLYDEISCEGYAWAWAATHADPQLAAMISDREWALTLRAFGSYLQFAATHVGEWPRYLPAEAG